MTQPFHSTSRRLFIATALQALATLRSVAAAAGALDAKANRFADVRGGVPSLTALKRLQIEASTRGIEVLGCNEPGDGGHISLRRVASEPPHAGKARSLDRYLPDGRSSPGEGGWWQFVAGESGLNIRAFGAKLDGINDDTDAVQAAIDAAPFLTDRVDDVPLRSSTAATQPVPAIDFGSTGTCRLKVKSTWMGFHYGNYGRTGAVGTKPPAPVYTAIKLARDDIFLVGSGAVIRYEGYNDPSSSEVNYMFASEKNIDRAKFRNFVCRGLKFDFSNSLNVGPDSVGSVNLRSFHIVGWRGITFEDCEFYSSSERNGCTISLQNCEVVRKRNLVFRNTTQCFNYSYVDDVVWDQLTVDNFVEAFDLDRKVSNLVATNLTFKNGRRNNQCLDINSVADVYVSGIKAANCGQIANVNFKETTPLTYAEYVTLAAPTQMSPSRNVTIENVTADNCGSTGAALLVAGIIRKAADFKGTPPVDSITFRNVRANNCSAIVISEGTNILLENIKLNNCITASSGNAGAAIFAGAQPAYPGSALDLTLRNVEIDGCLNHGLFVTSAVKLKTEGSIKVRHYGSRDPSLVKTDARVATTTAIDVNSPGSAIDGIALVPNDSILVKNQNFVSSAAVTAGGKGYTKSQTSVTFSPSPSGHTAKGVPIVSGGVLTGITITDPGLYSAPPIITIAGDGSGAVATAALASSPQNGLYTWQGPSVPLIRRRDSSDATALQDGTLVAISEGAINGGGRQFTIAARSSISIGSSAISWVPYEPVGASFTNLEVCKNGVIDGLDVATRILVGSGIGPVSCRLQGGAGGAVWWGDNNRLLDATAVSVAGRALFLSRFREIPIGGKATAEPIDQRLSASTASRGVFVARRTLTPRTTIAANTGNYVTWSVREQKQGIAVGGASSSGSFAAGVPTSIEYDLGSTGVNLTGPDANLVLHLGKAGTPRPLPECVLRVYELPYLTR